jgi:tetratricopeptide (TPR) repeat protein
VFFTAARYEESRAASERVLELEPGTAIALSNIAATSALLGDQPRAREALDDTLRVWPDMSVETLRTLNASVPEKPVAEFFRGLRLAGWPPEEADAATPSIPS